MCTYFDDCSLKGRSRKHVRPVSVSRAATPRPSATRRCRYFNNINFDVCNENFVYGRELDGSNFDVFDNEFYLFFANKTRGTATYSCYSFEERTASRGQNLPVANPTYLNVYSDTCDVCARNGAPSE